MVNPIISICFGFRRKRSIRRTLPGVRSTVAVTHGSKHALIVRIRRRVNRSAMHYITVSDASKLGHKVRIIPAKRPVSVPVKGRVGNHIVGIMNSAVSNVGRLSGASKFPVRHRPPGFRSLTAARRMLFANVGIVSLLRPCLGNNGVNLFNKTNIKGAILVGRLVGGVTGGRGNFSIFTKINRHAHRNGSLLERVVRSNMVHCNSRFLGDVRRKG